MLKNVFKKSWHKIKTLSNDPLSGYQIVGIKQKQTKWRFVVSTSIVLIFRSRLLSSLIKATRLTVYFLPHTDAISFSIKILRLDIEHPSYKFIN